MKAAVQSRKIKYVWHFTRLSNLESIIENGLISRRKAECLENPPAFNDQHRFDGEKDAICCSISHPNYKMFWQLRQDHADQDWIVLACKPEVLWQKDCAFCVENAASNSVTCMPIEARKGVAAFERMFDEIEGKPTRKELELRPSIPTNPQAEILVFDDIEREYIAAAVCETKKQARELAGEYPGCDFGFARHVFSARADFKQWQ